MIKSDLTRLVAKDAGISKSLARDIINVAMMLIIKSLASGEHVQLLGFGSFFVKTRKGRSLKLPNSSISMELPDRRVVKFVPAKRFLEKLKG